MKKKYIGKNLYKYCPRCKSDKITMEHQGHIIYYYKKGKFYKKLFNFPTIVFECLHCYYREERANFKIEKEI